MSIPSTSGLVPDSRATAIRWFLGWMIVPLGSLVLAGALDQVLDPTEPDELYSRAGAALFAGVVIGIGAALVTGLGFMVTTNKDTRRALRWAIALGLAPAGISIATAASLCLTGVAVALTAGVGPWLVTVIGFALLALGRWLGRGFWGAAWSVVKFVGQRAVNAITAPRQPGGSSSGSGSLSQA